MKNLNWKKNLRKKNGKKIICKSINQRMKL